ncbi:MAG TPA: UbiA family prenyltransferase, partial [Candidatus Dormibacteraeota bacterium]|nr:UbiA family prenyltransferase [Candidatus Dormibacteraeota bacterium]
FLYMAGMFLNDAFDAAFDRQFRRERPIPAGMIGLKSAWVMGVGWLMLGIVTLFCVGKLTGQFGIALAFAIVLYDCLHKKISFAPVLMGLCRFVLYLTAASAGTLGVTGWAVWGGLALGLYIVGISYFARAETSVHRLKYWPAVFLAAPLALAVCMNSNGYLESALLLGALSLAWIVKCVRYAISITEHNVGRMVAGLLAGIVLVDWVAMADAPREMGFLFIGLFGSALLLQKVVPAT